MSRMLYYLIGGHGLLLEQTLELLGREAELGLDHLELFHGTRVGVAGFPRGWRLWCQEGRVVFHGKHLGSVAIRRLRKEMRTFDQLVQMSMILEKLPDSFCFAVFC